jgi:hypothetical protein
MARREYIANELEEKMENENCDINTHYNTINKKYEYYNELNNTEKQKQINDNDEYYYDYYENNIYEDDHNSSNYNSDDYDDYYCDYISEDDSEYYSDDY